MDELTGYLQDTAATPTIQNAMALAVEAMAIGPGNRVLDVGCGTGVFLPKLAEVVGADGSIVALDHVVGFLTEARELMASGHIGTPVQYVEGDALRLPFPDATFDACHTERVLIHLSDPNQCLREMRRVVRPGGWVVCVEPDLDGMRIDHPDPAIARVVVAGFTETVRHPAMGLQLNRRMAEAGLVGRRVWTLTEVERELADDTGPFLRAGAMRLANEGRAEPEAVSRGFDWLERQSAQGRYTSYTSMFVVAGRVP